MSTPRPRRPWYRFDPFAAVQRLRAFLAARLGRRTPPDDPKRLRAFPELVGMDFRNPPSDSLAAAVVPLAATAAALAAGAYLYAHLDASGASAGAAPAPAGAAPGGFSFEPAAGPGPVEPAGGAGGGVSLDPADTPAAAEDPDDPPAEPDPVLDTGGAGLDEVAAGGGGGSGTDPVAGPATGGGDAGPPGLPAASLPAAVVAPFAAPPDLLLTAPTGPPADGAGAVAPATPVTPPAPAGDRPTAADGAGLPARVAWDVPTPGPAPVAFVANAGQWDAGVDFAARADGYAVRLVGGAAEIDLPRPGPAAAPDAPARPAFDTVRLEPVAAAPADAAGEGRLASVSHFFRGPDPAGWHTSVPEFGAVRYAAAWPGADLVYHGSAGGALEFDVVLAPGADPSAVAFAFAGAAAVRPDGAGGLVVTTPGGAVLTEHAPVAYQDRPGGGRDPVPAAFTDLGGGRFGFAVGPHDPARPLVIDPILSYDVGVGGGPGGGGSGGGGMLAAGSYTGTTAGSAQAIKADAAGNAYVAGWNAGLFSQSAFVTRLDPAGDEVWTAYLGGTNDLAGGFGADAAYGLDLDPAGNVYVAGVADSSDFPTTGGAFQTAAAGGTYQDAFVTKLTPDGATLAYSTFLGGSAADEARGVAVDPRTGEAVVAGTTVHDGGGADFPLAAAAQAAAAGYADAFVTRVSADGSGLVYSTLLGGADGPGNAPEERAYGVAVDDTGTAWVVGATTAADFPAPSPTHTTQTGAGSDAFVAKYAFDGFLTGATRYGGTGDDAATAVAVDRYGGAYVAGWTDSTDLPTAGPIQGSNAGGEDAFVANFGSLAAGPGYATYLGGSSDDRAYGIAVDADGKAVVAGRTASADFPTTADATAGSLVGSADGFLSRLAAGGGGGDFSTYQGSGVAGAAAAAGPGGRVYAAGGPAVKSIIGGGLGDPAAGWAAAWDLLPPAPAVTGVAADTGASGSDGLTADATPTLTGTWVAGEGVAVYDRPGGGPPVLLGTATADGSGDWSFTPSALADGAHAFVVTGTAAYASATPPFTFSETVQLDSAAFPVTVDTTPPAVSAWVDGPATSTAPAVEVGAGDAYGLDTGVSAALDVDLNNDGDFTDTGESGYASSALSAGGAATFTGYTPLTAGATVGVRVRVTDLAGNVGASGVTTVTVTGQTTTGAGATTTPTDSDAAATGPKWNVPPVTPPWMVPPTVPPTAGPPAVPPAVPPLVPPAVPPLVPPAVPPLVPPAVPPYLPPLLPPTLPPYVPPAVPPHSPPFVPPAVPPTGFPGGEGVTRAQGVANPATAAVVAARPLDRDYSPGVADFLVYTSSDASPRPTVQATLTGRNDLGAPAQVVATLTWDGGFASADTFSGSRLIPGGDWVFALQPADDQATGRHTYTMDLFVDYPGTANDASRSLTGYTFAVNRSADAYGAGWSLASADRLIGVSASGSYPAGKLRALGTGGWKFYAASGGGYASPAGDPGTLAASGGGYAYTAPDGSVRRFDSPGRQTALVSADGALTVTYAYDGSGRLSTVTAPDGGVATLAYDGSDRVETVTAPGNRVTTLAYAGSNLTQLTDPEGQSGTFAYDGTHRLTAETLGAVRREYTYANGMAATIKSGSPTAAQVAPAAGVGLGAAANGPVRARYTSELGAVTRVRFNALAQPVEVIAADGGVWATARTADGYVTGTTDPLGNRTTYAVDAAGYDTGVQYPDQSRATFTYLADGHHSLGTATDGLNRTTTFTYTGAGDLETVTDPLGARTTLTWSAGRVSTATDPLGRQAVGAYDAYHRLTGVLRAGAPTGTVLYDAFGEYAGLTDPLGNTTTIVNDRVGNPVAVVAPGGVTATAAYDAAWLVTGATSPAGTRTSYAYDGAGRVTGVTEAVGTGLQRTTVFAHDAAGRLTGVTDALGGTSTYGYDPVDRLTTATDPLGGTWRTRYDRAGRATDGLDPLGRRTQYRYDGLARVVGVTDAAGHPWTASYDAAGDAVAVTDPRGNTTTAVYDPHHRVVAAVDGLGNRATLAYDAAGQLVTTIDPRGDRTTLAYDARGRLWTAEDALTRVTTLAYDAADNPVAVTDAKGKTATVVYDLGRPVAAVDPLGGRTTLIYDAAGRVEAVRDANDHRSTLVYDALDRVVATVNAAGDRATVVYDALDRVAGLIDPRQNATSVVYDAAGRVTEVGHGFAWTTFDHDAVGNTTRVVYGQANEWQSVEYDQLDRVSAVVDGTGGRTEYAYDGAGNLARVTDPRGNGTTFTYDAADRLETVQAPLHDPTTFAYDPAGNRTNTLEPLGRLVTYAYDELNRLTEVTDPLGEKTTYVYDEVGNLLAVADVRSFRTTFAHDAVGRLTGVTDPFEKTTTYAYDLVGNVTGVTDARQRRTTVAYDAADRPAVVTDAAGGVTTLTYDPAGNVHTLTDPDGRTTTYLYDDYNQPYLATGPGGLRRYTIYNQLGNLRYVTDDPGVWRAAYYYDPAGRLANAFDTHDFQTTFSYDAAGNPVATTDPNRHTTTAAYDAADRAVTMTDPDGKVTTTSYDGLDRVRTVVDPLARTTTFGYGPGRQVTITDPEAGLSTLVFDAALNVVAVADPRGNRTTTTYDGLNRPVEVLDALGGVTTAVYDAVGNLAATVDPRGNRTTYAYDGLDRLTGVTDALNKTTALTYTKAGLLRTVTDPLTNTTTYAYDVAGRPLTTTDAEGGVWTSTTDGFRSFGLTDPNGHTATTTYDYFAPNVAATDALNHTTTAAYDPVGNLRSVEDPLGRRTTYAYDRLDRLVGVQDPTLARTTLGYDAAGNLRAVTDPNDLTTTYGYDGLDRVASVTDPMLQTTSYAYDPAGNLTAVTTPRVNTYTFDYDNLDRRTAATDPLNHSTTYAYDRAGNLVGVSDAEHNPTTATYDELNRVRTVSPPTGGVTTFAYDDAGRVRAVTDALDHTTTYGYDRVGRPTTTTNPLGFTTTTVYDAAGRVRALVDADGNRTTWAYDAADRVTSETDPLNQAATYAYDDADRVASATDRLGRRRDFAYDGADRPTGEQWYDATPALTQVLTYTYDAGGRPTGSASAAGAYTLTYDDADRVSTVAEPFGLVLTFGYDADGNRTGVQDSKGGVATSVYDAAGRLESRRLGGAGVTPLRADYTYTARDQVETVKRYADLTATTQVGETDSAYDAGGRLTNLKNLGASSTVLGNYTYTYDTADRVTAKVEGGATTTYDYDAAGQLTRDGALTFSYDPAGNRTNPGYAVGAGNRVTTDGAWTYTYDLAGNVGGKTDAAGDAWAYSYDNRGQLVAAAYTPGGAGSAAAVTYAYDAWGNQVSRDAWDGTTAAASRYGIDGWDTARPGSPVGNENADVWADLDGSNDLEARRVYGAGVDEVLARQDAGGAVGWYNADMLGSVRGVTDGSGVPVATAAYDAYGNLTAGAPSDEYGYAGRPTDTITGLVNNRQRPYDAELGRFYEPDPSGLGVDDNGYRYVRNQPTGYTDPSGLEQWPRGESSGPHAVNLFFNPANYPAGTPLTQTLFFNPADYPPGIPLIVPCGAGESGRPPPPSSPPRSALLSGGVSHGKEDIVQSNERKREPWEGKIPIPLTLDGSRAERRAVEEGTETFMVGATLIMMAPFFGAGALAEGVYLLGRGASVGGRVLVDAGKFYAPYVRALPKVGAEMVVPGSTGALGLGSPLLSNPGYTPSWLRNQLTSKPGLGLPPSRGLDPFRGFDPFRSRGMLPVDPEPFPGEPFPSKKLPPGRQYRYGYSDLFGEEGVVVPVRPGNQPGIGRPELVGPPAPATPDVWVRPKGWQLPKNGTWEGTPGHSNFIPSNPAELGLKPGEVVPFRNGRPDFSKWTKETFTAKEPLTGNPTTDQKIMIRTVAEAKGWTQEKTIEWLKTTDGGYSLHHAGGDTIQLVPSALHGNRSAKPPLPGIHHQGGAYDLRNPK